jgi:addiction module RelE/StbE family toxin
MKLVFHRNFEKQFKKLRAGERGRVKERLALFLEDEFDPILNNHPLRGKFQGYRSINITGDLRAVYKFQKPDLAIFIAVDMHSKLYKS